LQPCWMYTTTGTVLPWNTTGCTSTATTGNTLDLKYDFGWSVADNGNVNVITNNRDTTRSQSFTYDQVNRIATAETSSTSGSHCWGEKFGYDQWANLLSIGVASTSYNGCTQENLNLSVNASNQISSPSGYVYDAAGNLTTVPAPGSASYTYNAENQVTLAQGVTYTYDGDGKRVQKSSGKLYWYGVGSDPIAESDLSGNITDEYVFFNGKRIGRRDSSGNVVYYFADHLTTSRIVTNATGTILDDSDFYPFGGERVITSSSGNTYKFTGKERDSESGLDNFGARYDSSSFGRFMKPDEPLVWSDRSDPQSLNLYSYAENNPVSNTDDGHSVTVCASDGNGGQQCTTVSDEDYSAAQQADKNNIAPSLSNLANSSTGAGTITNSSGDAVGTVQWTPDNPGIQTLGLAGQMAEPGVNVAAQGLRMFGYVVAAPVMVAAECAAGASSCTKGNAAMAILPEVGALREGAILLKEGAALGKGAEILQKAGGVEQAAKDFESLQGTEAVYGSTKVKTLSDGSRAVLYQSTGGSGATTIAIQNAAGSTVTKIRY